MTSYLHMMQGLASGNPGQSVNCWDTCGSNICVCGSICVGCGSKLDVKGSRETKAKERERSQKTINDYQKCEGLLLSIQYILYYIFTNISLNHVQEIHVYIFISPGCDLIPVEYLRWGDPEPIAAVVFACLGQMATFFVTAVFIR